MNNRDRANIFRKIILLINLLIVFTFLGCSLKDSNKKYLLTFNEVRRLNNIPILPDNWDVCNIGGQIDCVNPEFKKQKTIAYPILAKKQIFINNKGNIDSEIDCYYNSASFVDFEGNKLNETISIIYYYHLTDNKYTIKNIKIIGHLANTQPRLVDIPNLSEAQNILSSWGIDINGNPVAMKGL